MPATRLDSAALRVLRSQPFACRQMLQTIKAWSLLLGHMSALNGQQGQRARSPVLQPCGLVSPVHYIVQPGRATPRKTSNEHGHALDAVPVDSYECRKGGCVISRDTTAAEPHHALESAPCCPQPLSLLTHQCWVLVPSAWTLVQGDPQG